jgi:DNA helicase-2/ATP-dependent DNA helicase PcrA
MAVTFTNKAAKEMLTRLGAMLPVAVRGMWIGTFHGLCNRFLRAHWKLAGLPQASRSSTAATSSGRQAGHQGHEPGRRTLRAQAGDLVHRRQQGRRPAPARHRAARRADRKLVEIYQAYEDQCQREGVVDFAELMLRTYELMRDNDGAA